MPDLLKPNAEETDLKLVIEALLKKNGLPENVKVTVEVEEDARKVLVDTTFINRIMYNLVNNAVQAMPKGGKLTIHSYRETNDVLIAVKDTGVGIPEAVKSKLFTSPATSRPRPLMVRWRDTASRMFRPAGIRGFLTRLRPQAICAGNPRSRRRRMLRF